jgi:hypothetical protein
MLLAKKNVNGYVNSDYVVELNTWKAAMKKLLAGEEEEEGDGRRRATGVSVGLA